MTPFEYPPIRPKRTGLKQTKPRERGSGLWRLCWASPGWGSFLNRFPT